MSLSEFEPNSSDTTASYFTYENILKKVQHYYSYVRNFADVFISKWVKAGNALFPLLLNFILECVIKGKEVGWTRQRSHTENFWKETT